MKTEVPAGFLPGLVSKCFHRDHPRFAKTGPILPRNRHWANTVNNSNCIGVGFISDLAPTHRVVKKAPEFLTFATKRCENVCTGIDLSDYQSNIDVPPGVFAVRHPSGSLPTPGGVLIVFCLCRFGHRSGRRPGQQLADRAVRDS